MDPLLENSHPDSNKSWCKRAKPILISVLFISCLSIGLVAISKLSRKSGLIDLKGFEAVRHNLPTTALQSTDPSQQEIAIRYFPEFPQHRFSKFRCSGAENDIDAFDGRLCVFNNICYKPKTQSFYYYHRSPTQKRPLFYDATKGMIYDFENYTDPGFLSLEAGGSMSWTPIVSNESYPTASVTTLRQLHYLMHIRFAGDNIAHGLWEDFGSISYSMERMNVVDPNLIIMHFGQREHRSLTEMYNEYVIPALSPMPIMELGHYAEVFGTEYVCFKQLMAGGQLSVFPKPKIRENHGREALFYNWRSKIIRHNGFDPNFVPKRHHILITNKSQSIQTRPKAKLHRAIVNLEEVAEFVQKTYPDITSEVIEWHTVPFNQQIEKLLNTTILITPCGGVSLIIPFLPHGAHAIVMDYYVNQEAHGFSVGQSGSMEGAFLNHVPHVRKQYYQLYGPEDFEFDFPGAMDSREDASVIVNITRLHVLMDKALEEMEP